MPCRRSRVVILMLAQNIVTKTASNLCHPHGTRSTADRRRRALFDRIESAVVTDLGGEDRVSAVALRLIHAFCGASILAEALNVRILTGQKVDPVEYTQLASCLVRIGSRLGLQRVPREVEDLQSYLRRVYGAGVGEEPQLADEEEPSP